MITSTNGKSKLFPSVLYGLGSDEKPTDVSNASVCYEMDTKKAYLFDEENKRWLEQ